MFKILGDSALVKLNEEEEGGQKNAYPMQLNPDIYAALFATFCEEGSAVIHVQANVCSSLVPANEMGMKIHCFERVSKMIESGVSHAVNVAAIRDMEEQVEVQFYFIVNNFSYFLEC